MDKLSAHSLLRITAVANVQETEQLWSQDDDFAVQKPELNIEVNEIIYNKVLIVGLFIIQKIYLSLKC